MVSTFRDIQISKCEKIYRSGQKSMSTFMRLIRYRNYIKEPWTLAPQAMNKSLIYMYMPKQRHFVTVYLWILNYLGIADYVLSSAIIDNCVKLWLERIQRDFSIMNRVFRTMPLFWISDFFRNVPVPKCYKQSLIICIIYVYWILNKYVQHKYVDLITYLRDTLQTFFIQYW